MKSFIKNYTIDAPIEAVWACLTDQSEISAWGASPVNFDDKVGGEFNMWGDYLKGKVVELVKPSKLTEEWLVDGMEEPSLVTFELNDNDGTTEVVLTHSNVPDDQVDDLSGGWDEYYMGEIKTYLENS